MTNEEIIQETLKVLVKEFNKLKKEVISLKKENEILATEIDRLYRLNYSDNR